MRASWAAAGVGAAVAAGLVVLLVRGRGDGPSSAPRTTGFEERAEAAGIRFRTASPPPEQGYNLKITSRAPGRGGAAGDVDGDGLDDLYFCNQVGGNALYRGLPGGRFQDVTAASGEIALADRVSVSAVFADIDADGDQDLYVTTTRGGNVLFRNDGKGRFADASAQARVGIVAHSQGATFFDADGDGLLDLLVSNTARWTVDVMDPVAKYYPGAGDLMGLVTSPTEANVYFHNVGSGRFADETEPSGLAGTGWSGDTAVFDFDEDGDADVFVANMFGASHLYENDGKGRFTDATKRVLGRVPWGTVGCKALDYDDDGRLDLFTVDMHSDMWMETDFVPGAADDRAKYDTPYGPNRFEDLPAKTQDVFRRIGFSTADVTCGNALFHALGGGRFEEVSARAGVETLWPWGIAAGDFDGDGWEDAFLPSGMGWPYEYLASRLLMNAGDGTFSIRSAEAGLDPPPRGAYDPGEREGKRIARSSRAAATGDFDADGRVDVIVNNFNGAPYLLMNRWPKKRWVGFRLEGTRSNRDAIGAVVRLRVGGRTLTRQVHAAGGYLAQSSLALTFGLGDADRVDGCEITWPGGRKQTLEVGALDTVHRVKEP